MNLHYSQTKLVSCDKCSKFDYHMNLHYSQTMGMLLPEGNRFDYHMNLHYSQTDEHSDIKQPGLTTI